MDKLKHVSYLLRINKQFDVNSFYWYEMFLELNTLKQKYLRILKA